MKRHKLGLLGTILVPTQITLGLALCALGFFIYLRFSTQLYVSMDEVLKSKADGLIASIDLFWRLEGKDRNAHAEFISFAKTWVSEKSPESVLVNAVVQISDESGVIIAASRNVNFGSGRPIKAGQTATIEANFNDGKTMRLRVYAQDVPEKKSPGYRILVGQPILVVDSAINNLRAALLLIIPAVLLFLALTITMIARRGLKPLNTVIASMERVGAQNMSERVSVRSGTREIEALGKSFDTMLERLDQAFTEQRAFIADLSHQIKTPLAIVKGQLETTLRRERSRKEYEEVLESGLEEIDTIARLIEKLLLLARYDSLEIKPDFHRLDLSSEIQNLVDDFSPLAQSRSLAIRLSIAPELYVWADSNMIRQVFINLFDNAVKYADPRTEISVSVQKTESGTRFSVHNFGPLISASDIPHLFERFRRFSSSDIQGFGLGLSIVDSIAKQHGASIDVKSDATEGTEFSITFPPVHAEK